MAKHIYVSSNGTIYQLEKGQEDLLGNAVLLRPKEGKALYIQQCKNELKKKIMNSFLEGRSALYAVVRSVASSGMSRRISFHVYTGVGLVNVSGLIADVLEWQCKDGAVVVKGCGMDMVHHTVESLSRALYGTPDSIAFQTI